MRLALVIEYEGTRYHGFQFQPVVPTIQQELERAIALLTGERSRVEGAGRTDAGVHATGQVVAFDTEAVHGPETFVRALNHYLPEDIAVKAAHEVDNGFDPRRMALSRRYVYTLYCRPTPSPLTRRTALHVGVELNVGRMRRAARYYVGAHDLARFSGPLKRAGASTIRVINDARVRRAGDIVRIEVEGNAFLPHQVRRMAGALVDVGRGRLAAVDVRNMMAGEPGHAVARALPAHGLCLANVTYADFPPQTGE